MAEICYCGQRISPGERRCSFCAADLALVRRLRAQERGEIVPPDSRRYQSAFRRAFVQSWLYGLLCYAAVLSFIGILFLFLLFMAY